MASRKALPVEFIGGLVMTVTLDQRELLIAEARAWLVQSVDQDPSDGVRHGGLAEGQLASVAIRGAWVAVASSSSKRRAPPRRVRPPKGPTCAPWRSAFC